MNDKTHGERIATLEAHMEHVTKAVENLTLSLTQVVASINKSKGAIVAVMCLGPIVSGCAGEVLHHFWH